MSNSFKWLMFLAVANVAVMTGAAMADEEGLTLAVAGDATERASVLTVEGDAGRYDRLTLSTLTLPLALSAHASTDAGNVKILAADLFLKGEGSGKDAPAVTALSDAVPAKQIDVQQAYEFALQPLGPIAQNAIAACNGLPASGRSAQHKVTMSLAVLWRVTTGRFNFKWTNYDQVAPSDDILNNRDFYADQATEEAEATVDTTVICKPLAATVASSAAPAAPVKHIMFEPEAPKMAAKSEARPAVQAPNVEAPVTTASLPDKSMPQCDGGMVRQIGSGDSGYLCLCPGNTRRVETSANAFACERGSARR